MLYQLDESHADDLRINSLGRSVRTRLYFTSESHMHTLLNVLRYCGEEDVPIICAEGLDLMDNIKEISYLSQIVIRLFEDRLNPLNFHCELSFSPGAVNDPIHDKSDSVAPYVLLDKGIKCGVLIDHLESAIKLARQPAAASPNNTAEDGADGGAAEEGGTGAKSSYGTRKGSVTVNMDQAGTSDQWENTDGDGDGGAPGSNEKKKAKKDKKDKKNKEK